MMTGQQTLWAIEHVAFLIAATIILQPAVKAYFNYLKLRMEEKQTINNLYRQIKKVSSKKAQLQIKVMDLEEVLCEMDLYVIALLAEILYLDYMKWKEYIPTEEKLKERIKERLTLLGNKLHSEGDYEVVYDNDKVINMVFEACEKQFKEVWESKQQ